MFSIECGKTKTKVITLTNHKDADNPENQSKLDAKNTCTAKRGKPSANQQDQY